MPMTVTDVLSNIFSKLYSYRLILIECYLSNDNTTVKNVITVETLSDIARIRLNDANFHVIESHFLKKSEEVEDMLRLMLKANDLRVNSISYIIRNEFEDVSLHAFSKDEVLIFSFYSVRDINTTYFSYETFSEDIDIAELIKDYQDYIDLLKKEKPQRLVIILNDPIKDFRKKKLKDIGIDCELSSLILKPDKGNRNSY